MYQMQLQAYTTQRHRRRHGCLVGSDGEVSLSVVKMVCDKVTRVDRYRSPRVESAQLGSSIVCSANERIVHRLWIYDTAASLG
jgi:hypothetical protein